MAALFPVGTVSQAEPAAHTLGFFIARKVQVQTHGWWRDSQTKVKPMNLFVNWS